MDRNDIDRRALRAAVALAALFLASMLVPIGVAVGVQVARLILGV